MGRAETEKKRYMSVKEMGDLLGITKSDRYYLVKKGCFKVIKAAGKMWVETESFEEWYAWQTKYRKVTGEEPGSKIRAGSFSVKEMAGLLGITESMAYYLIGRDRIPVICDSGKKRIRRKDFWTWHDCQGRYRADEDAVSGERDRKDLLSIPEAADLLSISPAEAFRLAADPDYVSILKVSVIRDRMYLTYRDFDLFLRGQDRYCYDPLKDPDVADVSGSLYLNARQAGWYAKVSRQTLAGWCRQEGFPVKRAGNVMRIPLKGFDEWLKKRKLPV